MALARAGSASLNLSIRGAPHNALLEIISSGSYPIHSLTINEAQWPENPIDFTRLNFSLLRRLTLEYMNSEKAESIMDLALSSNYRQIEYTYYSLHGVRDSLLNHPLLSRAVKLTIAASGYFDPVSRVGC
jgi:hypothetical protein